MENIIVLTKILKDKWKVPVWHVFGPYVGCPRIGPMSSMLSNSAYDAATLSGGRRRAHAWTRRGRGGGGGVIGGDKMADLMMMSEDESCNGWKLGTLCIVLIAGGENGTKPRCSRPSHPKYSIFHPPAVYL